jgi:2-hydroxy-6-oxonona-2,4-dienedioate hydrolase
VTKILSISLALCLALAVAGVWVFFIFQRDVNASREQLVDASSVIQTRSGPVEYAELGTGPVVLVVHGAGGGFDQGLKLLEPLASRGFRLLAISRFGYLRTPMPANPSTIAQADALAHLMDALGIHSAAIFGVSAGGPSSLQFAIRHPRRCAALVLMVPIAYKPPEPDAAATKLPPLVEKMLTTIAGSDFAYWLVSKLSPDTIIKVVMATPPEAVASAGEDEQARVDDFMKHILPISSRVRGIVSDSAISNSMVRYPLEEIRAPSLLMSARDDLYGTYDSTEYTAKEIRGAKFVGFESGGHMLAGHFDEAIAEIEQFLKLNLLAVAPEKSRVPNGS